MIIKYIILICLFLLIFYLHKKYIIETFETNKSNDIPKILHLIWIGTKKAPENILTWTNNFQKANPDWTVKVWGNKEIDELKLVNKKQFDAMKEYCGKADIARYEIVYRYGGMYIDADTLWLENPIKPNFLKGSINFFYEKENLIANGWFVANRNHPFLKLVIDEIPKRDMNKPAWKSVGPQLITDVYNKLQNKETYDIQFVDIKDVLCPTSWHGINNEKYKTLLEQCKKEKRALAFHYGISTNNL